MIGRVYHFQIGPEAQLHGLIHQCETARDQCLRCDDGSHGSHSYTYGQKPFWHHIIKGSADCQSFADAIQEKGRLTEIIEQKADDDKAPADADILLATVTEIGIKRLASGCTKEHSAEDPKTSFVNEQ